jgi:hypothetical protein
MPTYTTLLKRALFAVAFLFIGISAQAEISISWDDNSPGAAPNNTSETGFEIERSTGSGGTAWTKIATTLVNVVTYVDTNTTHSTTYNYRVRAISTAVTPNLTSAWSNTLVVTTPPPPPPVAPSNLRGVVVP